MQQRQGKKSMKLNQKIARAGLCGLCTAWLVGLPVLEVRAEQENQAIVVQAGGRTSHLVAVQEFAESIHSDPALVGDRARRFRESLQRGIAYTPSTSILSDAAFMGPLTSSGELAPSRDDCPEWRSGGADAFVEGRMRTNPEDGRLEVEIAVWDVARCVRLLKEKYSRAPGQLDRTALLIADDIVGAITGRRGASSTEIVFVSTRSGHREIVLMDADGRNTRGATRGNSVKAFPTWMPGSEGILYTAYVTGRLPDLFVTARSSRVRAGRMLPGLLPEKPKYRGVFDPKGKYLALVTSVDGAAELFRVERDTQRLHRLTHSKAIEISPAWSPDGKRMAFVSDRSGSPQIYVMDRDGRNKRRLTFQGGYNTTPAWSPDGLWIAYQSRLGAQFDIWLIDPEGKVNFPLVEHPRSDEGATWSPDGRRIAFSSTRRGRADIYTVDRSGGNLKRLTRGMGDNTHPSWSPYPR